MTRYGPLDVPGTIGRDLGSEELLPHSAELEIGNNLRVRVLDLETLIAIKEELGGPRRAPHPPQTLEEKRRE